MKKIVVLAALLVLVFALLACRQKQEQKQPQTLPTVTPAAPASTPAARDTTTSPSQRKERFISEKMTSTVRLSSVDGTCVSNDGAPMEGVEIGLLSALDIARMRQPFLEDLMSSTTSLLAKTDASGKFAFRDISPGRYCVRIHATGLTPLVASGELGLNWGLKQSDLLFKFGRGVPLRLRAVDEQANGLANASVSIKGWTHDFWFVCSGKTDDSGYFSAPNVPQDAEYFCFVADPVRGYGFKADLKATAESKSSEATIVVRPRTVLRGTVYDPAGQPVAAAQTYVTLSFKGKKTKQWNIELPPITTSGSGSFDVACPAGGSEPKCSVVLCVVAKGFAAEKRTIELDTRKPNDTEVRLSEGFSASGTVADNAGRPIGGAQVALPGYRGLDSLANSGGHFALSGLPGKSATLNVRAHGYANKTITVEPSQGKPVKIVLSRGGSAVGRVYDKKTFSGVTSAKVLSRSYYAYDAPTNAKGEYQLHFLRAARQSLEASAEGYARSEVRDVEVADEMLLRNIDFALIKGATISGRVSNSIDKKPIADATVSLSNISGAYQDVQTDASGQYSIKNVPAGKPRIRAKATGYIFGKARELLCDGIADISNADLVLTPAASIEGKVTDKKGKPVAGADVGIQSGRFRRFDTISLENTTKTDDEGKYSMSDVAPDSDFSAIARHEDYAEASLGPFRLKPGEKKTGVDFILTEGGSMSGKVTDENKQAIAAAEVTSYRKAVDFIGADFGLVARASESGTFTKVEKDGTYRLKHLAAGQYGVLARANKYAQDSVSGITVKEGEETKNVNFVLAPEAAISGVVLDSSRKPIAEARVSAMALSVNKSQFAQAQTAEDGAFVLKNIKEGKYVLSVWAMNYPMYQKQGVAAPSSGLEIILESSGVLRGQVLEASSNRPVENFEVKLQFVGSPGLFGFNPMAFQDRMYNREQFFTSDDGTFQFFNLKPGTYNVTATAADYASATKQGVKIPEGVAREDVVLYLEKGASVSGRVLAAADSTPVALAEVKVADDSSATMFGLDMEMFSESTDARTCLTDDKGNYMLLHLPNGTHSLLIKKDGFLNAKQSVTVTENKDQQGIDILMYRGGTVTGRIVDMATKEPVADAQVFVAGQGFMSDLLPEFGNAVASNSEGRFSLQSVETGKKTIKVSHRLYSAKVIENVEVKEGEQTDLGDVLLSNGGIIKGTVSDSQGRPLSGITLIVWGPGGMKFGATNDKGEYQFENLSPGNYTINAFQSPEVFTSGQTGQTQTRNADVKEGETTEVNFEIAVGYKLFGVVTENGKPVEGFNVTYSASDVTRRISQGGNMITDDKGYYEFRDVMAGGYNIFLSTGGAPPNRAAQQLMTRRVEITDHDVEMNFEVPASLISGRVTDAQTEEALAGAMVYLFKDASPRSIEDVIESGMWGGRAAYTDEEGKYLFEKVDQGAATVVVRHKNYAYENRTLTVAAGDRMENVDFALRPGLKILGKALARETQQPIATLVLLLEDQNRNVLFNDSIAVDSSGNYQIEGLRPGGYRLSAFPRDLAPLYNIAVQVPEGADATVNLAFDSGGTLALTVLDEQGKGVQKAKVEVRDAAGNALSLPPVFDAIMSYNETFFTDDSGKLTRRFIPAGTYSLEIRAEGFETKTVPSVTIQNKLTTEQSATLTKH